MIKRMSLEYKGNPVRLRTISVLTGALNLNGNSQSVLNARIWESIMAKQWDGEWYSLLPTIGEEKETKKTYNQLNKKKWFQGFDSCHLVIRATEQEGICFHWEWMGERDAEALEIALKGLREQRATTRRKK